MKMIMIMIMMMLMMTTMMMRTEVMESTCVGYGMVAVVVVVVVVLRWVVWKSPAPGFSESGSFFFVFDSMEAIAFCGVGSGGGGVRECVLMMDGWDARMVVGRPQRSDGTAFVLLNMNIMI